MEEEKGGGGSSSRVPSPFAPAADADAAAAAAAAAASASSSSAALSNERQRFTVELRPGETTIVSWKKLMKELNKANRPPPSSEPPAIANPIPESRIVPGQPDESELKDEPPSHRFSAVIEKIERLYMVWKLPFSAILALKVLQILHFSDEEELDDVPDDDQYDTGDSFIDDAELDEYFQVDKSATKHKGFFVNRGKLERINEPISSPKHQPKKRRRKDMVKAHGEKSDDHVQNELTKSGNLRMKAAARTAPLVGKASSPSQSLADISEHYQDGKSQNQVNAPIGSMKKKSPDPSTKLEQSSYSKISNRDASTFPVETKNIEKQKTGITQSRDLGNKMKVASESSDAAHQKYRDKSASTQLELQSRRLSNNMNEVELSAKVRHREKSSSNELPDLNFPGSNYPVQTMKTPPMHVKEGSSVRPKGTMLERAIRELEKMVVESRPSLEIQDADTSSQAIKRRLPREVKQKLAKVARLAQSSQGKISEELINRLMSILGHLVQLKTLKRNLKEMVVRGLYAKQAKDDRFQQIKKEVIEMIRVRVPSLKPKVSEQRDGSSDDFQEVLGSEEKGVVKGKYSMDYAVEDKICDLYDLYVEGMDEDKGPQIRKLYVELAELWPNGAMDNHGIKNGICKAKERKRALNSRLKQIAMALRGCPGLLGDRILRFGLGLSVQPGASLTRAAECMESRSASEQEKSRRKKLSTPRMEEIVHGEASLIAQSRSIQERLVTDSSSHILTSPNRISTTSTANQHLPTSVRMSSASMNDSTLDRLKQKVKGSTITFSDDARRTANRALMKKKEKRKPESDMEVNYKRKSDMGVTHYYPEKISPQQGKERHKSHNQAAGHPQKSSLQAAALPSCEQPG
ncbi:hypothetical protein HHK36_008929 [Tetracentron sinense]|uniref:Hpc2-related domain-containing protein n=1 Tax=Tetracentron sinense TaxID=13715 RepID=A0A834ZC62_TETSI|nr:hypothetical protein HHK36_008929 [Tetracentron sinense]